MDKKWNVNFLRAMSRESVDQEKEFLSLVNQVEGCCSLDIIRILMKSYMFKPDHGTQERVESVLAGANKADVVTAILEELPRLMNEAPEWAEVLVGKEVDNRPELLIEIAKKSSKESQEALRSLLARKSFHDFFPNAKNIRF